MLPDETRKKLSWCAFFTILLLVCLALGLYLYNIFRWAGNPDFGYSFRTATGIHVVGVLTAHGEETGLKIGDRIVQVNGRAYASYSELNEIRKWGVHEENTYLIERGGTKQEITVPNTRLGFSKSFQKSGLPFIFGLCYIIIGVLVFLMKPHHRSSWVFFVFATVVGLFMATLFKVSVIKPGWLENAIIFAYAFIPAAIIHLALSFPEERSVLRKHPFVSYLPYCISAVIFTSIRLSTSTMSDAPKLWVNAAVIYLAISLFYFLGSCLQLRFSSISQITRLRARMILLGFAVACSVPLADFVINALFGAYLVPGFNYYLPFFIVVPLAIGYSIVKHDLFDIDTIIKRTYGYVLTTGVLAGVYGIFVLTSNLVFGGYEFARSPSFVLAFMLAIVFFFNPIRNRAQRFVDRVFYRLEYDYQETVQRISESLRTILGLEQIGQSIMDNSVRLMFVDTGSVLIRNRARKDYEFLIRCGEREGHRGPESTTNGKPDDRGERDIKPPLANENCHALTDVSPELKAAEFSLAEDNPLVRRIAEQKEEVTVYDILEDPFFESDREECLRILDQLGATLIVPLIYEDRLIGLLTLGRKKSGKFYRKEDINLLHVLANQGAIAVENARMVEEVIEKERMEEELNIARDLQMSMFPAACPEVKRFQIAASSIPAREVGGDFYDFIEMEDDKVGLVVADVTGKSVSGALVMSSSRSVFRMLSELKLGVGDTMVRANRRIKKDVKAGMFVALLYAVLDAREGDVSLCSAGQTQPVHFSAKTGEAVLVETQGDNFPLGILDEAEYQETSLSLAAGDMVVFYTDGIVEAMNEQQEIFGFERLLQLVEQTGSGGDAEKMLKVILEKVGEFVGSAKQHDDITIIVVSLQA